MGMAESCCRGALLQEGLVHFSLTDGIMNKDHYVDILTEHLKTSTRKLKLGHKWVLQMENDHKHASKVVTKWLNMVKVLEWQSQSPDLSPNVWAELK